MSDVALTRFTTELAADRSGGDGIEMRAPIDDVAWYDFTSYEYLLDPAILTQPEAADDFSLAPPVIDDLVDSGTPTGDLTVFTTQLSAAISAHYLQIGNRTVTFSIPIRALGFDHAVATQLAVDALHLSGALSKLLELFWPLEPQARLNMINAITALLPPPAGTLSIERMSELADVVALGMAGDPRFWYGRLVVKWTEIAAAMQAQFAPHPQSAPGGSPQPQPQPTAPEHGYAFDLFDPDTRVANLGLRLVHRQEWRQLGTQAGDVVRTIPLGPKQVEKVSTRVFRRTKVTKTSEQLKTVESSTETADTTKDSSEVANEASKSFGWHAEAEATGQWGWGSAKVSGGVKSDSEAKSSEKSSRLAETMQKTANRIRSETKVVVATESETQFEQTTSSEIQNPNDEIAVTFVYRKLQSQYEVFTSLADVTPVVMVAERVPLPAQVTTSWILRYDWIIAKALLDDSLRDTLSSLARTAPLGNGGTLVEDTKTVMNQSVASLGVVARNSSNLSLSEVDITQEAQRAYQQAMRDESERSRQQALRSSQEERLLRHVRDNILHYCRAIWSQEDPEQRVLRYRRQGVMVPTRFEIAGTSLEELLSILEAGGDPELTGWFVASEDIADRLSVADVMQPSVPIGFVGNYAVFPIRATSFSDPIMPFDILLTAYLEIDDDGNAKVVDPDLRRIRKKYDGVDTSAEVESLETRLEMADVVPELRLAYRVARELDAATGDTGAAVQAFFGDDGQFEGYYPDFVFRKGRTRKIVLDTNNVVVDVLPGRVSLMEAFKRAHRLIDVKKAEQELIRRQKLIDAGHYGDPEVDKVTVITGKADATLVNVAAATEAVETG